MEILLLMHRELSYRTHRADASDIAHVGYYIRMSIGSPLRKMHSGYKKFQPFTDDEAWLLFKIAAFGEAIGWSLLIVGVYCKSLSVAWHDIPVAIAGRIHGTLFLVYIVAVLVLSPSLRWSLPRILLAGLCSVPPYSSLMYELASASLRKQTQATVLYSLTHYRYLCRANKLV